MPGQYENEPPILPVFGIVPGPKATKIHLTSYEQAIEAAPFLEPDELGDVEAFFRDGANMVILEPYTPRDRDAIKALRRTIEASHAAIARVRHGLVAGGTVTALASNSSDALVELGGYAERLEIRNRRLELAGKLEALKYERKRLTDAADTPTGTVVVDLEEIARKKREEDDTRDIKIDPDPKS